jgi:ABC-type hemin transport system substrate-binding protein
VSAGVRVVSLVPSASETLVALGVTPVACTRFCELPDVPTVGGTKRPDIDAITALHPDLVVVNDEENRREDARLLVDAGVALHSMSPRSVLEVGGAVRDLAGRIGAPVPEPFGERAWDEWVERTRVPRRGRAFVAVWRRPWMSLAVDTYGASLLALLGIGNVYDDALDRYPEVDLDDVAEREPDLVVLPSEPYVFTDAHVPEVVAQVPGPPVVLVDGRDLFWWGIRTPAAAARLAAVVVAPLSR